MTARERAERPGAAEDNAGSGLRDDPEAIGGVREKPFDEDVLVESGSGLLDPGAGEVGAPSAVLDDNSRTGGRSNVRS